MRFIRNATGFLFGIVIAICAGLAMMPRAHGQAPSGAYAAPVGVFMVTRCDEMVVAWVFQTGGTIRRIDPDHAPTDPEAYVALVAWLKKAPIKDVYVIPCPK